VYPLFAILAIVLQLDPSAEQEPAELKRFFEHRLAARQDALPPSYETLLTVIDGISKTDAAKIESALPVVSVALKSDINNLAVEAAFAMTEIAKRPDGGSLLRGHLVELESLLSSADTRLSGAAVLVFDYLTTRIPEATVPVLVDRLARPGKPTIVKSEIARVLLKSRKNDSTALRAVENYLELDADASVRTVNLQAIGSNPIPASLRMRAIAARSLDYPNPHVKLAALLAVYALGPDARRESLTVINRLAADPSETFEVREMADRVVKGTISDPTKKFPGKR